MVESFNKPHDDALSDGLFDEQVVIHFFQFGRSGEMKSWQGLEPTRAWLHRSPKDGYVITLIDAGPCEPNPDLPAGERSV